MTEHDEARIARAIAEAIYASQDRPWDARFRAYQAALEALQEHRHDPDQTPAQELR